MDEPKNKTYIDQVTEDALDELVSKLEDRLRVPFSSAVRDGLDDANLGQKIEDLKKSIPKLISLGDLKILLEDIKSLLDRFENDLAQKKQIDSLNIKINSLDGKIDSVVNLQGEISELKSQFNNISEDFKNYKEYSEKQFSISQGALALILNELDLMQRAEATIVDTLKDFLGTSPREENDNEAR